MKLKNKISKIATTGLMLSATCALTATTYAATASKNGKSDSADMDKASYSIGYNIGKSFNKNSVDLNISEFDKGLSDGVKGTKSALTDEQMKASIDSFQKTMMEKGKEKAKLTALDNKKKSDVYMAKVAKTSSVKKIEDGLYYKVLKAGKGTMPTANDTVTVNYEGKLVNGTVFDSSYKRGKPAEFQVNQVIPGWTKALEKMPQGSTWMLYIAPDLAYGKFAPPSIGPEQALIFKVELIKVKSGPKK
jgi:FKBP-type peptidyl-prolyl cis-trans isomerase FklB